MEPQEYKQAVMTLSAFALAIYFLGLFHGAALYGLLHK